MEADSPRRWYQSHWITWFVVVIVGAGFVYCQFVEQPGLTLMDAGYTSYSYFGWPFIHDQQIKTGVYFMPVGMAFPPPSFDHTWYVDALMLNALVGLLFVGSTAVVFECWLRSRTRMQFTLSGLGKFIAVISVLMTFVIKLPRILSILWRSEIGASGLFIHQTIAWPIAAVILLGGGCTIYSVGSATCRMVGRLYRFVTRRLAGAPS